MALDTAALDQPLARDRSQGLGRTVRFRLDDVLLPAGDEPAPGARLRCCTCGHGAEAGLTPEPCGLCGSHTWEIQSARARALV